MQNPLSIAFSEDINATSLAPNAKDLWFSVYGLQTLLKWDVLGALVVGIIGCAWAIVAVDWFPHSLLIAQVLFVVAALYLCSGVISHAIHSGAGRAATLLFCVISCAFVLYLFICILIAIQAHKHDNPMEHRESKKNPVYLPSLTAISGTPGKGATAGKKIRGKGRSALLGLSGASVVQTGSPIAEQLPNKNDQLPLPDKSENTKLIEDARSMMDKLASLRTQLRTDLTKSGDEYEEDLRSVQDADATKQFQAIHNEQIELIWKKRDGEIRNNAAATFQACCKVEFTRIRAALMLKAPGVSSYNTTEEFRSDMPEQSTIGYIEMSNDLKRLVAAIQ